MVALCLAALVVSIVCSTLVTLFIRTLAQRYEWASGLTSSHHIHERRVPRLGGIAIYLTFLTMAAVYVWLARCFSFAPPLGSEILKLLIPAGFLFLTGLIDDLRGLSARAKLLGQVIGGLLLYASGFHLFEALLRNLHPWAGTALSLGATVFFVVLMCNAMNLIDGLDGLSAGVSLFSMVTILVFAWVAGAIPVVVATVILAGSVAGFLFFNFCPASIFLGDSGSLFLGFMLSGLVISLSARQERALNSLLLPVFCFALPLADTGISVLRRFISRRPLFQADRGHVHHMLLNLGLSHRAAVLTLYTVAGIGTIFSFVLLYPSYILLASTASIFLLGMMFCVRKLGYQEFASINWIWQQLREQRSAANLSLVEAGSRNGAAPAYRLPRHGRVPADISMEEMPSTSVLPDVHAEEAAG
ncbi:MAG TPA: MraY family glycosyltransferase [Candidatus Angelobacter sp.]|nr:MraY family glycosyltransferase [Candidatus Angelobacter sp.]